MMMLICITCTYYATPKQHFEAQFMKRLSNTEAEK